MKRREFITLVGGAAAAWPIVARGQERKFARIGALVLTSADAQSLAKALREGLREFGYAEGQNFAFEVRSADGNTDRLPELASELARLPVDVIVATFTPCALAAKQATTTGLPPEKWSSLMYGLWPDGGLKNGKEATHCGRDRHEAAAG
jgi:putative ABC transport system substrate-binding protein